jgi:hypothetical protein
MSRARWRRPAEHDWIDDAANAQLGAFGLRELHRYVEGFLGRIGAVEGDGNLLEHTDKIAPRRESFMKFGGRLRKLRTSRERFEARRSR